MKAACALLCSVLIISAGPAWSAPLDEKSKAPDWGRATQAEKDAWIAAFKFKQSDIKRAAVAECLDKHAGKPLFETNDLSGVTEMCGSIAALP
jgi:hypothetical protein